MHTLPTAELVVLAAETLVGLEEAMEAMAVVVARPQVRAQPHESSEKPELLYMQVPEAAVRLTVTVALAALAVAEKVEMHQHITSLPTAGSLAQITSAAVVAAVALPQPRAAQELLAGLVFASSATSERKEENA